MKRFHALDSFRGLCAMSVAVYHMNVYQSVSELTFFRSAHFLVGFFFVLSGFVMMHTYAQRLASGPQFRAFVISRTFRLYPLHVVMLLLAIGLEVAKLLAEQRGMTFGQPSFTGQRAPGEILPNLLLVQAWWPDFHPLSFNYPAWSISVEYWIYLIFGLLLLAFQRQAVWLFAALAGAALLAPEAGYPGLTRMVWLGLSCFFAGALTYRVYHALRHVALARWLLSVLEAASVGLVVWVMVTPMAHQESVLSLLFCVAVLVFAFDGGVLSALLRGRPFDLMGRLSYSIYMTHALVLFFVTLVFTQLGKVLGTELVIFPGDGAAPYLTLHGVWLDNALLLAVLGLIVGVSAISYRLIELKGIEVGKYLSKRGQAKVLAASEG